MESSDTQIIRYVEDNVLDQKYKQYPFFYRQSDITIPYLLKILGGLDRSIDTIEEGISLYRRRSIIQNILNAISHSLRWISKSEGQVLLPPTYGKQIEEEAMEALGWGVSYAMLVQDHVAFSRDELIGKVDVNNKTISFEHRVDFDPFILLTQAASEELHTASIFDLLPIKELGKEFNPWVKRFASRLSVTNTDWQIKSDETSYQAVLSWINQIVWPELPSSLDLGGYSLDDYRRLVASIYLHGLFFSWLEDYIDDRYDTDQEANSVVIADTEHGMAMRLSKLSGVPPASIRAILNDLIFDPTYFHSLITMQPFVRSKNRRIYFLARLIAMLDFSRMLATAVNRKHKRHIYERLVNSLEQANLDIIESKLRSLGFVVLREKRISDSKGAVITPDFLIFDSQSKELVVVDYKHTLAPIGAAEVLTKSNTIKEGKEGFLQLRKYLDFLRNNNSSLQSLGINVGNLDKLRGILLFRWPMALPVSRTSDVLLTDWVSLSNFLVKGGKVTLPELFHWVEHRPDLSVNPNVWTPLHHQIEVDDWTYNHLILVQDAHDSHSTYK
jgi:hypothetical protein